MDPIVAGSLIMGAGNLLGSAFGNNSSSLMQQQYGHQFAMAAQQQQYWKDQFKMINEYNDPRNVVQRYLRAGVSPSAAFGGSTVGQSQSSPSLGAGGSPVPYPPTMQSGMQMFGTLAQALSSLGSAFKTTAEGRSIQSMLGEQVRGLKLTNDQNEFRFNLDKLNLPIRQKLEIGKLHAESLKLQTDANLASQQELTEIEKRFKTIAERVNEITKGEILTKELNTWEQNFNSVIALRKSQIASNYGSAAFSNASATREDFFNTLRADPAARNSLLKELKQAGDIAVAKKKCSREEANRAYYLAEQAAFANDMKEFDWAFDKALKAAHGIYDGVSTIGKFFK